MEPMVRPKVIRFGVFEVDLCSAELSKDGHKVSISDQLFRVLAILLEKPGVLVTRQELKHRLWPEDTFVDFEHSLYVDIQRLRLALGDSAENPRFIETLPRKGYRFICPVETSAQEVTKITQNWPQGLRVLKGRGHPGNLQAEESESEVVPPGEELTQIPPGGLHPLKRDLACGEDVRDAETGSRRVWLVWAGAVVAALLIVAGGAYWMARRENPELAPVLHPLTTYPGRESFPSFSPDGNLLAFCWNGEKQDNWDIYIMQIGTDSLRRLTSHPDTDLSPVFSPDGLYIAFLRGRGDQRATLLQIPLNGGPEQTLTEVILPEGDFYIRPGPYLAWFPDAAAMAIVDKASLEDPAGLWLFLLDTHEKRRLTKPPAGIGDDDGPAISPDGHWLAFSRGAEASHLYLLEFSKDQVPKGEPKRITTENQHTNSPIWTPDGRELFFSMGFYQEHSLWRMSVAGGKAEAPKRLDFAGEGAWYPAISRYGNRLAFMRWLGGGSEIWRVEAHAPSKKAVQPVKLISSTKDDEEPEYSPNGRQIAFKSNRSGRLEIWVSKSDGSEPSQLTFAVGPNTFLPRWSPDGRHILFTSNPDGNNDLFLIDAQGGIPRRLTHDPSNEVAAVFSRDGRWIYFHSDRSGQKEVWKMPADANGIGGTAVQVTRHGGISPEEAPDGGFLYYLKEGNPRSLWKVPTEGGEEVQVLPSVLYDNFTVVEDGIYFIEGPSRNRYSLKFLDFVSGETSIVSEPLDPGWGLTVSPSSKSVPRAILYVNCRPNDSDLMLVENFH